MLKANVMMMVLNVIIPLVCGFIIDYDYRVLFLLIACFSILDIFITLPLPNVP